MNKKILLAAALLSFSSISMAMQITNGKLINHKEWSTGMASGTFLEHAGDSPLHIKHTLSNQSKDYTTISAWNKLYDSQKGKVGNVSTVGYNDVYISNMTSTDKVFTISTEMCSWLQYSGEPAVGCIYTEDQVLLKAQGQASIYRMPDLTIKYKQAGTYEVWIFTYVDTEGSSYQSSTNTTVEITK